MTWLASVTQVQVYDGPVMHNRAKKLQEVHAFLYELHCNIDENHILPKSCTLLLLRFTREASLFGYVKDAERYTEETKTAAQTQKACTHKTHGYMTHASSSRPSLHQLENRQGPNHTWIEAPRSQDSNPTNGASFGLPS
jgi:hypothetical protein